PSCGKVISAQTVQQMVDRVLTLPAGTRLLILAPVIRGRKGEYKKLFFDLQRQGYSRVRVNGSIRDLAEEIDLDRKRKHTIEVVVDRLIVRDNLGPRLADSLETALRLADGIVQVEPLAERGGDAGSTDGRDDGTTLVRNSSTGSRASSTGGSDITRMGGAGGSGTRPPEKQSRALSNLPTQEGGNKDGGSKTKTEPMVFSERLACADCGISFPEVSPRMFSFNNPYGACPECGGIGTRDEIDPDRLLPEPARPPQGRGFAPVGGGGAAQLPDERPLPGKRPNMSPGDASGPDASAR